MRRKLKDAAQTVARKATPHAIRKAAERTGVKLAHGGHSGDMQEEGSCLPASKEVCIMELASVVTGECELEGEVTDHPICCSDMLTGAMISVNDSGLTERQLAALKKYLPQVIGTAPTRVIFEEQYSYEQNGYIKVPFEIRVDHNREYKQAETRRRKFLRQPSNPAVFTEGPWSTMHLSNGDVLSAEADDVAFKHKERVLQQLLALDVPKFKQQLEAEAA